MGRARAGSATDNINVSWVEGQTGRWFWLFYVLLLVAGRFALMFLPISNAWQWTTLSVIHGLAQFGGLHWETGTAVWMDQGEYKDETFWEQMEGGVPWTATKKFFLVVPVVLFLVASHVTNYAFPYLLINLVVVVACIIPKLPEMHHVRLLGGKSD